MKKYQTMITNIWFIDGKIKQNSRILHDFCSKNARLHNKTTRSRPGRGQNPDAEAKAKASRPRPKFWPRGHFGFEDLTSLTNAVYFHRIMKTSTVNVRQNNVHVRCRRNIVRIPYGLT